MSAYRQKPKARADHTDDWLMTYADLITLLMCFFAIIVVTSIPKKDMQPKAPPPVVAQLVQPAPLPPPPPAAVMPQPPTPVPLAIFPGDLPFHHVTEEDLASDAAPAVKPVEEIQTPAVEAPPAAEAAPVVAPPALIEAAPQPTPADATPTGDRITSIEINSAAFFGSGSATLSKGGEAILLNVATKLKSDAFRDYQVTVEGHTDDTPVHTLQFPSNWELSTARASAVVHYLLEQGIPAQRLRAAGYADTFPKAPNRDSNGMAIPANQAENRRVVIKLEKIEKK